MGKIFKAAPLFRRSFDISAQRFSRRGSIIATLKSFRIKFPFLLTIEIIVVKL